MSGCATRRDFPEDCCLRGIDEEGGRERMNHPIEITITRTYFPVGGASTLKAISKRRRGSIRPYLFSSCRVSPPICRPRPKKKSPRAPQNVLQMAVSRMGGITKKKLHFPIKVRSRTPPPSPPTCQLPPRTLVLSLFHRPPCPPSIPLSLPASSLRSV